MQAGQSVFGWYSSLFVQACRGDKTDPGREVAADSADGTADGRSKIAMRVQSDGVDEPDALFFRTITIPAEADIFVAYSTPPGSVPIRSLNEQVC